MTGAVLGIDVGMSSVKVVKVGADGAVQARASAAHGTSYPAPLAQEQDPEDWVAGATAAVWWAGEASSLADVEAVAVTGHMSALVLTDGEGRAVRRAILLSDGRAEGALSELAPVAERVRAATGSVPAAVFFLPKLLWVRASEPDTYGRARRVMGAKDYVRAALTGEWASDASEMGNSLCLDLASRQWLPEVLEAAGVPASLWPPLLEARAVAGRLRPEVAARLGLRAGLPVVTGAADVAATLLGAGVRDGRAVLVGSGSSLPVARLLAGPRPLPGITWHPAAGLGLYAMASVLGAGASFSWWAGLLGTDPAGLEALGAGARGGADAPVWLPYLVGRGTPDFAPGARAALVGLSAGHGREDVALGVYRGVACEVGGAMAGLVAGQAAPEALVLAGGGASRLLAREIAAFTGLPVDTVAETHASAYGAAMLAADGVWGGEASAAWRLPRRRVAGGPASGDGHARWRRRYEGAVERLRDGWRDEEGAR